MCHVDWLVIHQPHTQHGVGQAQGEKPNTESMTCQEIAKRRTTIW